MKKILVISDLHIGLKARCTSMIPPSEIPQVGSTKPDENLVGRLRDFLSTAHPDITHVVVAGDIADRATHEQYSHFDEVMGSLLRESPLRDIEVVYTPGNHDVNWDTLSVAGADRQNRQRWRSRYVPIKESERIAEYTKKSQGDLFDGDYFAIWQTSGITFISINTGSQDAPTENNHPGTISPRTLSQIERELERLEPQNNQQIKMMLIHHHPIQYANLFPKWKDFSILQCEVDFMEFCAKIGIDIVVHGHRHQPWFKQISGANGHTVNVLAAGSLSENFPSYVYDRLSNICHIVEIDGRQPEIEVLQGKVLSYAFCQINGWTACNKSTDGIYGEIPFGPYRHFRQVAEIIKVSVKSQIRDRNFAKYEDVARTCPELKFVTPDVVLQAITHVCEEESLERAGANLSEIIMLPRVA